ncbi:MAG: 23S rRNA (uracil(1939)-C(5))-methyltransferase RlmD [Hydrogenibacillus sp.]|nr:23S rRNA (uracil(1939)-C(5))-methyltransferase RlmD [Hydrogenibacillus sp.]
MDITLEIERFDRRGFGAAPAEVRAGKRTLAVPYTIPGETVRAGLTERRVKGHLIAEVHDVIRAHPARIPARCPHFGTCGGCTWQHIAPEAQTAMKTERVKAFLRDHGLDDGVVRPAIGMAEPWHYRNKMEFTFTPEGALGLHALLHFDRTVPLSVCYIAHPALFAVAEATAAWARAHRLSGYDKRRHEGLLRHLMVRYSEAERTVLAALFATVPPDASTDLTRAAKAWTEMLAALDAERGVRVAGAFWIVYGGRADKAGYDAVHHLFGAPHIVDELDGVRYRIAPQTFFQTNRLQAERLLETALQYAEPEPDMHALDLFSGVGTFTLPLARRVRKAVGVEVVPEAVEAAYANARENGADNVDFVAGDVRRGMERALERLESRVDLVLLDPPRSGAGGKVMRKLGRLGAPRIVYVSCNPETFASDVRELFAFGYRLAEVQPVDMFPQTAHVELVARLEQGPRS